MGKVKIEIYCCIIADILTNVLQKCLMSCPPQSISFETKPLNLIGCHVNRNAKFAEKNPNSSEAIRGIKLKLYRIVCNISLYENIVFYCRCLSTLIAMETSNFHRLIMGKMKICIHCYFIADILTKVF